jgi:hypothetical protein
LKSGDFKAVGAAGQIRIAGLILADCTLPFDFSVRRFQAPVFSSKNACFQKKQYFVNSKRIIMQNNLFSENKCRNYSFPIRLS